MRRGLHTKWACPTHARSHAACSNHDDPWKFFRVYLPSNELDTTRRATPPIVYLPMTLVPRCDECNSMMTIIDDRSQLFLGSVFPTRCDVRIQRSSSSGHGSPTTRGIRGSTGRSKTPSDRALEGFHIDDPSSLPSGASRRHTRSQSSGGARVIMEHGGAVKRARVAFD